MSDPYRQLADATRRTARQVGRHPATGAVLARWGEPLADLLDAAFSDPRLGPYTAVDQGGVARLVLAAFGAGQVGPGAPEGRHHRLDGPAVTALRCVLRSCLADLAGAGVPIDPGSPLGPGEAALAASIATGAQPPPGTVEQADQEQLGLMRTGVAVAEAVVVAELLAFGSEVPVPVGSVTFAPDFRTYAASDGLAAKEEEGAGRLRRQLRKSVPGARLADLPPGAGRPPGPSGTSGTDRRAEALGRLYPEGVPTAGVLLRTMRGAPSDARQALRELFGVAPGARVDQTVERQVRTAVAEARKLTQ